MTTNKPSRMNNNVAKSDNKEPLLPCPATNKPSPSYLTAKGPLYYNRGPAPNRPAMCYICHMDITHEDEVLREVGCGNVYHSECLLDWIDSLHNGRKDASCPACRITIDTTEAEDDGRAAVNKIVEEAKVAAKKFYQLKLCHDTMTAANLFTLGEKRVGIEALTAALDKLADDVAAAQQVTAELNAVVRSFQRAFDDDLFPRERGWRYWSSQLTTYADMLNLQIATAQRARKYLLGPQ